MNQSWQERWNALNEAMARLKFLLETEYKGCARQETLETTLRDLQKTAAVIFQFLVQTPAHLFEEKVGLPVHYLIRQLLDQVAFDLDVISTAAAQRFFANSDIQTGFTLVDRLAYKALEPAIAAQLIHADTTVLTYRAQSARARIIPYAPVALIAVPFTAARVPQDLLATAHEIGHYVYWHGQFSDNTFWQTFQNEVAGWCYQWREEMFSDVYGALVTGAPVALSGQDLLLDNNPSDYWENDKEHPVIDLRPQLYCKVLHEMNGIHRAWAPFLKQRWLDETQQLRTQDEGRFFLKGWKTDLRKKASAEVLDLNAAGIVGETNTLEVDKALCKLYNLLQSTMTSGWLAPLPDQRDMTPSLTNIPLLYEQFREFANTLNNAVPELAADNPVSQGRFENLYALIQKADKKVEDWQQLVKLNGWVTRGPDEQPNPPRP